MSHPNNFVEGTFQSQIRRCVHSVWRPNRSRDSEPNPVCSLCTNAITRPIVKPKRIEEASVKAVDTDEKDEELSEEAALLLEWSKKYQGERNVNEEPETNPEGERASDAFAGESGDETFPTDESRALESIFDEGGNQE